MRLCFVLVFVYAAVGFLAANDDSDVTLTLSNGQIVGSEGTTPVGKSFHRFLGVPYAKPPFDNLRFRRPQPMESWQSPLVCQSFSPSCAQATANNPSPFQPRLLRILHVHDPVSEDCLYLNVWTPADRSERLPVMVWIHGGAFFAGSSALAPYDGSILATEQNVVVVTINYRLGVFGFFSLNEGEYKGNQGLFDQRMALQWVQQNIDAFGGDPDRVTIFGESAGAGSVSVHGISPLSKGLFKNGIMQSGSTHAKWAMSEKGMAERATKNVAKTVGCTGSNNDILECLAQKSTDELVQGQAGFLVSGFFTLAFSPTVDGEFIPQIPSGHETSNFENSIVGANTNEANLLLILFGPDIYNHSQLLATDQLIATNAQFDYAWSRTTADIAKGDPRLIDLIRHEYWNYQDDALSRQKAIDAFYTDFAFACPTVEEAERETRNGVNVYLYEFDHVYPKSGWPEWTGVLHTYEIFYIMGEPLAAKEGFTDKDRALSRLMMEYVGNFARTGDPNRKQDGRAMHYYWPKHSTTTKPYMRLSGQKLAEQRKGMKTRQCSFWKTILPLVVKSGTIPDGFCEKNGCS